jgi:hypothetical protein
MSPFLRVLLATTQLTSSQDVSTALVFEIGSSVFSDLTVLLSVFSESSGLKVTAFSPNTLTFTQTTSLKQSSNYVRQSPGQYRIEVELLGSPNVNYPIEFPRGYVFDVIGVNQEPSPPLLKSAVFSGDGSSVLVEFDSPTNQGGVLNSFVCESLLKSRSVTSTVRCVWLDEMSFVMYLPPYPPPKC